MAYTGSERVGPGHQRGTAVEHYAGIDVSLERSSVCVVDASGRVVREAKVASEPEALVDFFRRLGIPLTRVGLEVGPLSQWLDAGLTGAGPLSFGLRRPEAAPVRGQLHRAPARSVLGPLHPAPGPRGRSGGTQEALGAALSLAQERAKGCDAARW